MATCHSLRVVDGEIVGDPLDVKMFEFTGWSFEEGEQRAGDADDEEQGGLSPSIARPPPGMEYDLDDNDDPQDSNVSDGMILLQPMTNSSVQRSPIELGVLKSFEFVSQLRRASVIVRKFGSPGCDIYVKGVRDVHERHMRPRAVSIILSTFPIFMLIE